MTRDAWRQAWHNYRYHRWVVPQLYSAGDPDIPPAPWPPSAARALAEATSVPRELSTILAARLAARGLDHLYLPF